MEYPAHEDYAHFDQRLLALALAFRLKVDSGNSSIDFVGQLEGQFSEQEECISQCAKLGLAALDVSVEIQNKYRIPPFELERNVWDFKRALKDEHGKQTKRTEEKENYPY